MYAVSRASSSVTTIQCALRYRNMGMYINKKATACLAVKDGLRGEIADLNG